MNPLKHPLLKLEGDTKELRSFTVKLTDAGKAVLVGEAGAGGAGCDEPARPAAAAGAAGAGRGDGSAGDRPAVA